MARKSKDSSAAPATVAADSADDFGFSDNSPVVESAPVADSASVIEESAPAVEAVKASTASEPTDIYSNAKRFEADATAEPDKAEAPAEKKDEPKEISAQEIFDEALGTKNKDDKAGEVADDDSGEPAPDDKKQLDTAGNDDSAELDSLVARAVVNGISIADSKAMTVNQLTMAVELAEKRREGEGDPAAQKAAKEADEKKDDFKLDINEDDYDDDVLKVFKTLESQINELRKSNRELSGEREQTVRERRLEMFYDDFDNSISALPPEEHELFGKERGNAMKKESEQYKNRLALLEKIDILASGYAQKGMEVPPVAKLVDEAKHLVFGTKLRELSINKTRQKIEDRGTTIMSRTANSQTHDTEAPPRDAAVKAVAEKLREFASD